MTKKLAIKEATMQETINCSWDKNMCMWYQYPNARNRHELKRARIQRALFLLGYEDIDASIFSIEMAVRYASLREAIYSI